MNDNYYAVLKDTLTEDNGKRWRVGHYEDRCWITDFVCPDKERADELCRDLNTEYKNAQLRQAELKAITGLIDDAYVCFVDGSCTASITLSLIAIAKALALQLERVD